MQANPRDDTLALIALGVLAFILADTAHEALSHGLATLAVAGIPVLLTSSYFFTRGHHSRWIQAGGSIADVILGLLALACARLARKAAPPLLYFLLLLAAFNLLFAAADPFYSGAALFGDWASVIAGLRPLGSGALLIVGSVSLYWLFLSWFAVACELVQSLDDSMGGHLEDASDVVRPPEHGGSVELPVPRKRQTPRGESPVVLSNS